MRYPNTMETKQLIIYLTSSQCQNNKIHCIEYAYTIVKQYKIITVYIEQEQNDQIVSFDLLSTKKKEETSDTQSGCLILLNCCVFPNFQLLRRLRLTLSTEMIRSFLPVSTLYRNRSCNCFNGTLTNSFEALFYVFSNPFIIFNYVPNGFFERTRKCCFVCSKSCNSLNLYHYN